VHPDLADRVERIRGDDRHGASWLAKEAVEAIVEAVEAGDDPLPLARELVHARPAIGAIAGALGRVLAAGRTPEQLVEEANAVLGGRERAAKAIAILLTDELAGKVVMTHSASATAREALLHGDPARVICTVSEPVGEGRWFYEELGEEGLTTELVADEDAGHAVKSVDVLLLGADTVFRDGSLVNKIGTYDLTRSAKNANVPVIVACEVLKVAPVEGRGAEEERFDLTPPGQIDRFVTEEGTFAPDEIATLVDRTPFLREGYELLRGRR
jgi:translation initiation factor 2B subunit (eIF-2B alpha/beta/delta family)